MNNHQYLFLLAMIVISQVLEPAVLIMLAIVFFGLGYAKYISEEKYAQDLIKRLKKNEKKKSN